jgi:hypothetical protein
LWHEDAAGGGGFQPGERIALPFTTAAGTLAIGIETPPLEGIEIRIGKTNP